MTGAYDAFITADLDQTLPDFGQQAFDYVLALDIIEHLNRPEDFLDALRHTVAQWPGATVIITTGNVGFILMRLSLLLGRFEYGRRGILDVTHTRLFTFNTLQRAMRSAGFAIERVEGIVPPLPFIFGESRTGRVLMGLARALVKLRPRLFGFQCLVLARPRPTLRSLLARAHAAAEKMADAA